MLLEYELDATPLAHVMTPPAGVQRPNDRGKGMAPGLLRGVRCISWNVCTCMRSIASSNRATTSMNLQQVCCTVQDYYEPYECL
jgi:hypothetical protein